MTHVVPHGPAVMPVGSRSVSSWVRTISATRQPSLGRMYWTEPGVAPRPLLITATEPSGKTLIPSAIGRSVPVSATWPILPRFPLDITDEVTLARVAFATKDDELAQLALDNSRRRAELNPGVASIAATAAHVRGLLEPSHPDLREAVELFERTLRRLELAAALEDLGGERVAPDREAAVETLGRSLSLYTELGATWDARRVRSHLHELGVRRRIVIAEPETRGWAALTTSELAVVRLVADGLTNREAADRLFVSPHTVNSHLRHVFTKLGINSRVELARYAHENDRG
jgi:DNA-binding CsgD family transcriptional regulator